MATTSYVWQSSGGFLVNSPSNSNDRTVAVAGLDKHGFIAAWAPGTNRYLLERAFDRDGNPGPGQYQVNTTSDGDQFDVSIAGQRTGGSLMTFTDTADNGDIRGRLFQADGTPIGFDFDIAPGGNLDFDSDAAALADGRYIVSWTRTFDVYDHDVRAQIVSADGSLSGPALFVDSASDVATSRTTVAGLAGGGFVVGWQQGPLADQANAVAFVRYDGDGNRLDAEPVIIDDIGTVKQELQVVALQDGGFAFAYEDDGVAAGQVDIRLRIYNADGTPRTGYVLVNTETAGNQDDPTITLLGNGYIVVGWTDGDTLNYQAFDPAGQRVGTIQNFVSLVIEAELAGMSGGLMAAVRESLLSDQGDSTSIRASIEELTRLVVGDDANDTLNGDGLVDHLVGGGGKDKLSGAGGKDTLEGGSGDDVLRSGLDRDQLIGGSGADRFAYNAIAQSRAGVGSDAIKDFEDGVDRIDVEGVDAKAATPATDQAFKFIVGSFTAEGQVRAVQDGKDTLIQFNTTGANGADMEIVLKNFDAGDISGADFVL
jgi:Ca2+-binding RTX toxin-like protein